MKPLRFALIGVGNIAPVHVAAIKAIPDAELVAVATRNPDRGSAFVAEYGGTWYADYRDVLSRGDVDVVSICTPHDLHLPMTLDAAAAHKHVIVEKPMARNVGECDAMINACHAAGVTLGVVFQARFERLARLLKAGIDGGTLGRLLWTSANTIWYRSDAYYASGPWRGTLEHEGGGTLINQAIHDIDQLLWLSGSPDRVTARIRTLNHSIEVEDAAMAMLEYDDGRIGLIQACTIAYPGFPERLEFYGTKGGAIFEKGKGRINWHLSDPQEERVDEGGAAGGAGSPMDMTAAAHIAQFREFAEALRAGRAPAIDGREGRRSVELVEAIYRSARLDRPVTLPIEPE